MSVIIGHSSIDENGRAYNGTAGDQTAKEVCTRTWYSKPWDYVLRPIDSTVAEKMAKACEQACANNKIGYDQWQRNTLYTEAKKVNYDLSKITTACECDCSSLMCVCAICAGISADYFYIGGNMRTTSTMKDAFQKTEKFQVLTDSKYLTSDKYLKRGDILVKAGSHTVMALSNGDSVESTTAATPSTGTSTSASVIGTAVAKCSMNVRSGNGTSYGSVGYVKQGQTVEVLEIMSNNWYKIKWANAKCGYAFTSNAANKYYTYTAKTTTSNITSTSTSSYQVKITAYALNVRAGAGTSYKINTVVKQNEVYTIVEEKNGWGKLKSGAGWISLKYTTKV